MADTRQLRFNLCSCHQITVREMPKIKLHPGLETPVQWDFVDGSRAPFFHAAIHCGMIVPRRIQMGAVVCGHRHKFGSCCFSIRKVCLSGARKQPHEHWQCFGMALVNDFRCQWRWIRWNIVFQIHRKIDNSARHGHILSGGIRHGHKRGRFKPDHHYRMWNSGRLFSQPELFGFKQFLPL